MRARRAEVRTHRHRVVERGKMRMRIEEKLARKRCRRHIKGSPRAENREERGATASSALLSVILNPPENAVRISQYDSHAHRILDTRIHDQPSTSSDRDRSPQGYANAIYNYIALCDTDEEEKEPKRLKPEWSPSAYPVQLVYKLKQSYFSPC
ncbi:hypothetical protein KQX54_006687 [Cotesia glomerata]|uniref:Uncharacterized protein n=1 Tax=Cotesia glomerata TaxID=32391 RepID=A0AAV7I7G3_COTGL|nr:hypothetical protein KQX54_006687 [Cotesia glomerata]